MQRSQRGGDRRAEKAADAAVAAGEGENRHRRLRDSANFSIGCGKFYRARSRLYRNEILQENMRLKALAEIYTMHSFALL